MLFRTLWSAAIRVFIASHLIYLPFPLYLFTRFVVPTPHDPRPGRFVRHLDFNHFRTFGMRRLVDEGVNSRFVTGVRVQAILKVRPSRRSACVKLTEANIGNAESNCVWCH